MKVKAGLAKAILEEDFAAATVWVVNLHKFVLLYGLNFSKEDHIFLIKVELTKNWKPRVFQALNNDLSFSQVVFGVLATNNIQPDILDKFAKVFFMQIIPKAKTRCLVRDHLH